MKVVVINDNAQLRMKRMEEKNILNRNKVIYDFKIVVVETNQKLEEKKRIRNLQSVNTEKTETENLQDIYINYRYHLNRLQKVVMDLPILYQAD